jgi:hypothetical protein
VIWADYAPEALASWALRSGVDGISVEHFLLSERLVGVLRDTGLSVNAGTVNHPEVLNRVLEFAPDAIGTDRPHELRAAAETLDCYAPRASVTAAIAAVSASLMGLSSPSVLAPATRFASEMTKRR